MDFPIDPRVTRGSKLVEMIWWSLAKRIVTIAGEMYGWDEEQWREVTSSFLRPNDYTVVPVFD
jgi:hypothetical protein